MSEIYVEKTYHIEFLTDAEVWTFTGEGPMPFESRDNPQTLSRPVWVAYVDYLNARERDKDGNPTNRYRLSEWARSVTTVKEVIHV